jgi:hypothetical protein
VPCEWVFSGIKQVATDLRANLGPIVFEQLTVMKSAWGAKIYNAVTWNAEQPEEVTILDFEQMLIDDGDMAQWDKDSGSATHIDIY